MNMGDVFIRNAQCFGDHPAVRFEGHTTTHRDLFSRIQQLLSALDKRGVQRQDRIAILSRNCVEYLEIYGAAAVGGLIGVGINYRLSLPEQTVILQDADPAVVFFEDCYTDRVDALRASLGPAVMYVCISGPDGAAGPNAAPPPSWSTPYASMLATGADGSTTLRARDDDTFLLIYTSGTTGLPKGVMLGSAGQLEQTRSQAISHLASQTDRMLIVMPFYHIGGPTELFTYLITGGTIVLHRTFDAVQILDSLAAERVTVAHLAPTMIQMLLDALTHHACDLSTLHTIVYASAPMSVALSRRARAAFGPIFMQIYGMTEVGLGSVLQKHQHVLDGPAEQVKRLASAGQPYFDTDMRIVRDDFTECAVGEVGDIWVRSPALMQGYWRRPDATAAAFHDGFLKTGDMGYWDDDHFLFIVDRRKDMIVSGGENIYSREVEEALLMHPAVAEAAVIGVPDPQWGESVMAVVVLRPGAELTLDDAITHCRSLIASYKKPKILQIVDTMPRVASTNKIDKKTLREPYWRDQNRQIA
jgi:acyl-CoA synthetase (AMP-forming)/AMP-acid ligase II